ncbi:MAG TPA: efflux RND transporter periplasmic adaptor subunit [Flavitalea sp.]|nr:efflux RND transporter periplasmic adaptor subunit [Flavitalea sp.]
MNKLIYILKYRLPGLVPGSPFFFNDRGCRNRSGMDTFIFILFITFSILGCSGEQKKNEHAGMSSPTYTCPMHPEVAQDKPGKCPVCGMDLVLKTVPTNNSTNSLMLNESQMRLANITTQKVSYQSLGQTSVINGKLITNEEQAQIISSRAAGRIEKLYVKETGVQVRKGEPLYELYSENILALGREYLLAKEQADKLGKVEPRYYSFLKAAESKLILYGLSKKQIEQIGTANLATDRVTFLSPATGIVTELKASEGQYLPEGGAIYKIENISSLWLEAELYQSESSLVKMGDNVSARISGFESEDINTKIIFLSPEYRANTQITIMRATINNAELKYKPGMQAQVFFTHSSKKALTVPSNAVIRDEKGMHVYVQIDVNTFAPRIIQTGVEDFEQVEVLTGLKEGEIIAATGAYLLYSELVLKKGIDPMKTTNN